MPDTAGQYLVYVSERAERDLDDIPSRSDRFSAAIETLAVNPERGHVLREDLSRCRSLVLSHGHGGYRAVYQVFEDIRAVVVFAIGPHRTVYDTARRRYPPPKPEAE